MAALLRELERHREDPDFLYDGVMKVAVLEVRERGREARRGAGLLRARGCEPGKR